MIRIFGTGPRVKNALLGVWDRTFGRKRRQIPGTVSEQCFGKNDRFRTVLGSMNDYVVPKNGVRVLVIFPICHVFLFFFLPTLFSSCFQRVILSVVVPFSGVLPQYTTHRHRHADTDIQTHTQHTQHTHFSSECSDTICAKIITEMRGADFLFFRININLAWISRVW